MTDDRATVLLLRYGSRDPQSVQSCNCRQLLRAGSTGMSSRAAGPLVHAGWTVLPVGGASTPDLP